VCKKSIKNSQPFVRKMRNIRTPQGGGIFFLTHTVYLHASSGITQWHRKCVPFHFTISPNFKSPSPMHSIAQVKIDSFGKRF